MKNTFLTTRHANAWTQKEVNLIKKYVKRYPSNLSVAFEKVSEVTGRSKHAICQKYYKTVKDDGMLYVISSVSFAVITAFTPGNSSALLVSILRILA